MKANMKEERAPTRKGVWRRLATSVAAMGTMIAAGAALATEYTVTTPAQLKTAVTAARSGDTVVISDGEYTLTDYMNSYSCLVAESGVAVRSGSGDPAKVILKNGGRANTRIFQLKAQATLTGVTLTGGTSGVGGALYCDNVTDVVVSNCIITCSTNTTGNGGGVNQGVLRNCVVTNNAAKLGGGVYGTSCSDSTIAFNTAVQFGGGVYGGSCSDCTLASNTAGQNGGGVNGSSCSGSTIAFNTAGQYGGGVYGGSCSDCTIASNTVTAWAGGGADRSALTNCLIEGNSAPATAGNVASYPGCGGGVFWPTSLIGCRIVGNRAGRLGGGVFEKACSDSVISNNLAGYSGGGVYGSGCTNCEIACNTATNIGGGACTATLTNCTVSANRTILQTYIANGTTGYGGGLWGGSAYKSRIIGNTAGSYGGGAYGATLEECLVAGNSTVKLDCGALLKCTAVNCVITNNASARINGTGRELALVNCLVKGNKGLSSGIGTEAFFGSVSTACSLMSCTVLECEEASTNAGAIGSGTCLTNTLAFGSSPDIGSVANGAFGYSCWSSAHASSTFTQNLCFTLADPKFVGAAGNPAHPYAIGRKSPCRNAGMNLAWMNGKKDLKGDNRIYLQDESAVTADIGAYECSLPALGMIISVQ